MNMLEEQTTDEINADLMAEYDLVHQQPNSNSLLYFQQTRT